MPAGLEALAHLADGDATVVGHPAPAARLQQADGDATIVAKPARPAAAATLTPPPIDADATVVGIQGLGASPPQAKTRNLPNLKPGDARGSGLGHVDPNATVVGTPVTVDPDATIFGLPATRTPVTVDPNATMLGTPVPLDPDATMVGRPAPAGLRPLDPDATIAGTPVPLDPDATFVGTPAPVRRAGRTPRPKTSRSDPGVTVIGPRVATPVPDGGPADGPEGEAEEQGPLEVGQQFGRYTIIRMLGIGGMGAVYQAWDEELEVAVAIKVIRPEITADPVAGRELEKRFKRELLLARQVTHKNVVRIHDLGEIDGIKYITMSYVHGRELASIVKEEGKLPVPKALKVMRGVVSGLAAANGAGVVHRDLKPANIMVEAETDEPLIMDFGIARSTSTPDKEQAAGAGQAQLAGMAGAASGKTPSALTQATTVGAIVGTVSYMSPEQVRAEDVDQRADLYALGLIFYDMLLGPKRFEGMNPIEELQKRMVEPPASPRSVDETIPETLDRIIMRCLAPDRNERYETTADLEAELNKLDENGAPIPVYRRLTWRTMTAAATLTLSLMGATYWLTRPPPPKPETPPMSVLVADFENRTNDPVFTGTVEKALGLGLEGASFITAYSREEAARLGAQVRPGSKLDESVARLVSAREGIKVILAGSIEPKGRGFSLAVRAIDPAVDKVLAETTATANSKENVLPTVARIAADLRGRLGDTTPESARLAASETVTASSLEALQAYTRAQELADSNRNQEALAAYEDTVRLDPNFGRAYAGMGVIHAIAKDEVKAKAAYDEALKRVDRMSEREKLRTLGTYYMMVARNYEKAIENYETLVKLYPADDGGHGNLGLAYLYIGNIERARAEAQAVLKIYPSQWAQRYNYAMYSMYAGDFPTAEKEGARVLKEAPTFELGAVPVALSMLIQGDFTGALATYDRLAQMSPSGASLARHARADLEMYRGRPREALKILQAAIPIDVKEDNTGTLAQNYLALSQALLATGQRAKAAEAARKAVGLSNHESVMLPAALVLIDTGQKDEAEKIAATLENMLQTHTTAYSRLIDAQLAVSRGRYAQAVELFRDSIKRRDTWFARFLLGRLYAETEHFPEAMAELDLCIKRRGEVLDVFFYDTPTARYLPPAYYWLGRAQQALGSGDAKKNYETFLATRAAADSLDPLAEDARKRLR